MGLYKKKASPSDTCPNQLRTDHSKGARQARGCSLFRKEMGNDHDSVNGDESRANSDEKSTKKDGNFLCDHFCLVLGSYKKGFSQKPHRRSDRTLPRKWIFERNPPRPAILLILAWVFKGGLSFSVGYLTRWGKNRRIVLE